MKKIKDATINLQADVNLSPVRKKISDLRAELRANPLKFQTEVDDKRIVESLAEAHQLYEDNPLHVETHTDTAQMEAALASVRERYRHLESNVTPHANTARAEAEIAALTRRRTVDVSAKFKMDPQIKKALSGLTYTMLGAVPAPAIKSAIAGVLGNLEQLAVKAAKVTTIVGSLSAEILTLGANAFSIVGDLGTLGQGVALLPAAFSGMAIALVGAKIAWKNFFTAFSKDAKKASKAMAELPTEAQDAVESMKGLWGEISKPAQKAFWVEMGTALQDTTHRLIPTLKKGFVEVEISLAKMTKGALRSYDTLNKSGGLKTIFDNTAKGLDNASKAVEPFFNAINRLSVTGSKYLPIFGDFLAKSADKFEAFIDKADKAGKIDVWIRTATNTFKDLGSILGSSGSIIKGLSIISDMSGGKGLHQMAEGLKGVADAVNSEPFRSRLVFVLEGARKGAEALGDGFGKLMDVVGRSTIAIRHFLTITGQIAGSFFKNLAAMFDGTGLGDGLVDFTYGVKAAMDNLTPTFTNIGHIIGDMGTILGVVLVNMVPGLNNLFETLSSILDELKDGIVVVIPILNDFVQNVLVIIAPIAIGAAHAIGELLKAFAALPDMLKNVILGIGLFLIILAKLKSMFKNTADGVSPLRKRLEGVKDAFANIKSAAAPSLAKIKDSLGYVGAAAGYAKDAIKKSFGDIRDSAKITGMYISDGFKKSFGQLGDAIRTKVKEPLKAFSTMMKNAWKEALMPTEVREGFRGVGQKLAEVARIYTGYVTQAKDALKGLGKAVASALPMGLLGPAIKALPGEMGKAIGHGGKLIAAGVADMAKTLAGPAVGYAMNKLKDTISTRALYASKRLEDIGKGIQTAVSAIQKAPGAVGGALSKLSGAATNAFKTMRDASAKAFNSGVLAAAIHPMTAPFVQLAASAKTAGDAAAGHMRNMAKAVGGAINTATVPARTAFAGLAVAASIQSGIAADKIKTSFDRVAGNTATAFRNAGREISTVGSNIHSTMGKAFSGITTAASTAASSVASTFGKAASNLKANFAPAASAIRDTFKGIGSNLAPAASALGQLAGASKGALGAIGSAAGTGLRGAATGLLGALGGGWGLAIGAATAAVTIYAQTLADSKQRVDEFAKTLEANSGRVTGATKAMLATTSLDGATDKWDDFFRGVIQHSASAEETLGDLGISTQEYTDKLADPKGRDSYVKGLERIKSALNQGLPVTDEMAAAIGSTKEELKGVTGASMEHLAEKARGAADELRRAEEKVLGVAKATGTTSVEAKILSKNWDILKDSASSASAKFTALKENLDLLTRSSATNANQYKVSMNADKAYQQSLADTKDAIAAIKAENNGLVTNLYSVEKGFDFTSKAGRDLHTALEGQTDAILKIGTAAMDQALKAGKSTEDAQKAAMNAMNPGIDGLKASLKELGFAPAVVDSIVASFGLVPKNITTALGVEGGDAARQEIFMTQLAADAFKNGNYDATLSALPDAAKRAIEDSTGLAGAFARGDYKAILEALDKTEGGRTAALARILAMVGPGAKYDAFVTALDKTGPGVDAAGLHIRGVTNANYSALIKAQRDGSNDASITSALDWLARHRTVSIGVVYTPSGAPKPPGAIARPGDPLGNNGGIINSMSSPFASRFPMGMVKAFANGGFENHVAQISRGQTPFRVWSEPETGGEAYIPLSKAKRPRSLKILEEVARMFGFSLYKQFANGGIMSSVTKGAKSPAVVTSSNYARTASVNSGNGSGSVVNFTVNPSQGLSEQQIGESAMKELYWQLASR